MSLKSDVSQFKVFILFSSNTQYVYSENVVRCSVAKFLFQVLYFMFPFCVRLVEGGFLILWLNQMKEKAVRERNLASNEQVKYSLYVCLFAPVRFFIPSQARETG